MYSVMTWKLGARLPDLDRDYLTESLDWPGCCSCGYLFIDNLTIAEAICMDLLVGNNTEACTLRSIVEATRTTRI